MPLSSATALRSHGTRLGQGSAWRELLAVATIKRSQDPFDDYDQSMLDQGLRSPRKGGVDDTLTSSAAAPSSSGHGRLSLVSRSPPSYA